MKCLRLMGGSELSAGFPHPEVVKPCSSVSRESCCAMAPAQVRAMAADLGGPKTLGVRALCLVRSQDFGLGVLRALPGSQSGRLGHFAWLSDVRRTWWCHFELSKTGVRHWAVQWPEQSKGLIEGVTELPGWRCQNNMGPGSSKCLGHRVSKRAEPEPHFTGQCRGISKDASKTPSSCARLCFHNPLIKGWGWRGCCLGGRFVWGRGGC